MYTYLPQSVIILSIKHFLSLSKQKHRRDFVCVNIRDPKLSHLGKGHSSETVSISFQTLFDTAVYEITHCYFTLASSVLFQKSGIGMPPPLDLQFIAWLSASTMRSNSLSLSMIMRESVQWSDTLMMLDYSLLSIQLIHPVTYR